MATTASLERPQRASRGRRSKVVDEVDQLVAENMSVAHAIARRYRDRGLPLEDLEQIADLALVQAARRFDPSRGHDFRSYAVPTIRGEIRKAFRDQGWTVRPPRRIQELQAAITTASEHLTQELGRSPRPSEISEHLGVPAEDIIEALASDGCYSPTSLDSTLLRDGTTTVGDLVCDEDSHDFEAAEARAVLEPALRRLSPRDRRILELRFIHGWTQEEIGHEVNVTQMHISRLLRKILAELREQLLPSGHGAGQAPG